MVTYSNGFFNCNNAMWHYVEFIDIRNVMLRVRRLRQSHTIISQKTNAGYDHLAWVGSWRVKGERWEGSPEHFKLKDWKACSDHGFKWESTMK